MGNERLGHPDRASRVTHDQVLLASGVGSTVGGPRELRDPELNLVRDGVGGDDSKGGLGAP